MFHTVLLPNGVLLTVSPTFRIKQKAAGQTTVQTIDTRAARIAERAARGEDAPSLFGIGAK